MKLLETLPFSQGYKLKQEQHQLETQTLALLPEETRKYFQDLQISQSLYPNQHDVFYHELGRWIKYLTHNSQGNGNFGILLDSLFNTFKTASNLSVSGEIVDMSTITPFPDYPFSDYSAHFLEFEYNRKKSEISFNKFTRQNPHTGDIITQLDLVHSGKRTQYHKRKGTYTQKEFAYTQHFIRFGQGDWRPMDALSMEEVQTLANNGQPWEFVTGHNVTFR